MAYLSVIRTPLRVYLCICIAIFHSSDYEDLAIPDFHVLVQLADVL